MKKTIVKLSALCLAATMLMAGCSSKDKDEKDSDDKKTETTEAVSEETKETTEPTTEATTEATTEVTTATEATTEATSEATTEATTEASETEPTRKTVYGGLTFKELKPVDVDAELFKKAYAVVDPEAEIVEGKVTGLRADDNPTQKLSVKERPGDDFSASYISFATPDDAYVDFMSWDAPGKSSDGILYFDEATSFGYLIDDGEVTMVSNGVRIHFEYTPLAKYGAKANEFFQVLGAYVEMPEDEPAEN